MTHLYGGQSKYLIDNKKKNLDVMIFFGIIALLSYLALFIYGFIYRIGFLRLSALLWIVNGFASLLALRMFVYKKHAGNFYFGSKAESLVWYLLRELPDTFHVFQDIKNINGLWGNIDFMVVGPTGVYTVEVKSHKGVIRFDGSRLTRDRWGFLKDFLKQAKRQSFAIHQFVQEKTGEYQFVNPLIVFTSSRAHIRLDNGMISPVNVLYANNLVQFIQNEKICLDYNNVEKIIGAFCSEGFCKKY